MTLHEFLSDLKTRLSALVTDERYVLADQVGSLGYDGRGRGTASVTFVNMPYERVKQRRGGGAESENNRMLFFVRGFNSGEALFHTGVDRVQVECLVDNIRPREERLRKKTGSPDKISAYLASFLNQTAEKYPPRFTHE